MEIRKQVYYCCRSLTIASDADYSDVTDVAKVPQAKPKVLARVLHGPIVADAHTCLYILVDGERTPSTGRDEIP